MDSLRATRVRLSRRRLIAGSAVAAGAFALSRYGATFAQAPDPGLPVPGNPAGTVGLPFSGYGIRSPFLDFPRTFNGEGLRQFAGASFTPLQDLDGMITPSDLHYQRNHNGTPIIDPAEHRLTVHGMVGRPKTYTVDEIHRFPRYSQIHFVECSGNSGSGFTGSDADATAQDVHGLVSTSEWIGVPVSTLIEDVGGVQDGAAWALAEGSDGAAMTRSIPLEKLMDDAMIAFIQNGEPIRPEQGFPFRLLLPGWEGNSQIKWLRRLEFWTEPFQTKEETKNYTDVLDDGRARQFTFVMEAKGLITWPSVGKDIPAPGFWEIRGMAWSGRGRVERVEVSVDGGDTWEDARLEEPVLSKAVTRFRFPWQWDGSEAVIVSRTTDETGYVQPTQQELLDTERYAPQTGYHYNGQQPWRVASDGTVTNGFAQ
ncbi:MAG: sulfite dehydrogenase [Dehalococcoidia bacterium]|nr:sulfite dehydrogenase [Dehalococcoidia bacterium]